MPTQPAIVGTARLGNFRLGYVPAAIAAIRDNRISILLDGVEARVRVRGLTIRDALNEAPTTCRLVIDDATPPSDGDPLRIIQGIDTPRVLFAGTLQTINLSYEGRPGQRVWPASAIDDTARANARRPFGTWVDTSATDVAIAITPAAFSTIHIEAALPLVSIAFDGQDDFIGCLSRLARLVGGYCKVEDGAVYLFLADTSDPPHDIDDSPNCFLNDPPITVTRDLSQLRTRVYGKGHSETLLMDVFAGEDLFPISDAVMFNPLGGQVIASTTPDGAATEILDYTGIQLGGASALVGAGGGPSAAPTLALTAGVGLGTGAYKYAYTDVTTSGESLPSPLAALTTEPQKSSPSAPTLVAVYAGPTFPPGTTFYYSVTYRTAAGETLPGPLLGPVTISGASVGSLQISLPIGGAGVIGRVLYRTQSGGSQLMLVTTSTNNVNTSYIDGNPDGALGANAPTVNTTAGGNRITVNGIATGPAAVTSRKLYRTVVNGSQLKLVATIANNTTTTYLDTDPDVSLGGNAPVVDASGLPFSGGQVLAGSATLLTSSSAPFDPAGGWVRLAGDQVVRYNGISGNTLTGIPDEGPGAIVTTVSWGTPVIVAPTLLHVTSQLYPLPPPTMMKGARIHLWVQRDDLAAQAADGIVEHVLVDERRGEDSLIALCDANLALYSRPIITVVFAGRDPRLTSGKTVVFDVTTPAIHETLVIQDVTIDQIGMSPGLAPRRHCTCSSVMYSLEDLLRRMATA